MSPFLSMAITATLGLYVLAMVLGLLRLMRGPSAQDRVLALDFLYTVGMLIMLVLAVRFDSRMYFEGALHGWLIIIVLSITAPVTTMVLGRAGLFRSRQAGADLPPPLARGPEP